MDRDEESPFWLTVLADAVLVLLLLVIAVHIVYEPVRIIGQSMEDTVLDGQTVLMNRLADAPKRGQTVIVQNGSTSLIKRVVAVGGDRLAFLYDGSEVFLYLDKGNGFEKAEEPYIKNGKMTKDAFRDGYPYLVTDLDDMDEKALTLDGDLFFVMGDNRDNSSDSRFYGPFNVSALKGSVVLTLDNHPALKWIFEFLYWSGASDTDSSKI